MPKIKLFTIAPYTRIDKRIEVTGPDGFRLWVDNDDVPPKVVEQGVKRLVRLLNQHWEDRNPAGSDEFWKFAQAFKERTHWYVIGGFIEQLKQAWEEKHGK